MSSNYAYEARVMQLSDAQLLPLVEGVVEQPLVRLTAWTRTQMAGGAGGGIGNTALYRFAGRCETGATTLDWSLILKVILPQEEQHLPASSHYWKREFDAYESGWLNSLPAASFGAARCYGTAVFPGEAVWLWLEDLQHADQRWDPGSLARVARHLGQFNGLYLNPATLPDYPWLSREWIRGDLQTASRFLPQMESLAEQTFLGRVIDQPRRAQCLRVYAERPKFLNALDRLPKTIQHLDAFSRNLFSRQRDGRAETIAIDWSFVGLESLGAELVSLFWVSLLFMAVDAADIADYEGALFENYIDGLRDAGWQGDPALVRLGFTAALALRHFGTMMYLVFGYDDATTPEGWIDYFNAPLDAIATQWTLSSQYIDRLADEARRMIDERS